MTDNLGANDHSSQSNCSESYDDYLNRAASACEAGDLVLGMHLYLAAYERAVADPDIADGMALAGLREAWNLACDLKERSMAEYVFEKLEPFLTGDEIAHCANKLQSLALDRLEEYGFSREDLQDMAEMISQDLMDGEGSIVKVESISIPHVLATPNGAEEDAADAGEGALEAVGEASGSASAAAALDAGAAAASAESVRATATPAAPAEESPERGELGMGVATPDFNPYDLYDTSSVGKSYHAATNEGAGSYTFTRDVERAAQSAQAREGSEASRGGRFPDGSDEQAAAGGGRVGRDAAEPGREGGAPGERAAATEGGQEQGGRQVVPPPGVPLPTRTTSAGKPSASPLPEMPQMPQVGARAFSYRALVGYDEAVSVMRDFGIGLQRDAGFRNFIDMMNTRHGLDRMPALDTLLFRSPAIEDATRFVDATIGEIGLPVLRMSMEEGLQGAPMLCVTTIGDSRPRMNHAHNRFDGPGILVIDDLNSWVMPQIPEGAEGIAGFMMANISRGAREAVNLIRSAVEDPDVYVLATASFDEDVDPFFYELLEPISIIDIALPTEREREAIWGEVMRDHPSMRKLDRADLVRLSSGLPRYDMYMAARAAVEDAYKAGLVERMYQPVTPQNIFDKLAACLPLDSDEYRAVEDEIIRSFRDDLERLEDLLDDPAE